MKAQYSIFSLLLAVVPAIAVAQPPGQMPPHLKVTGTATVSVPPEEAWIDIAVVTEAKDAREAGRVNAQKLDSVLRALREALGSGDRFETLRYSMNPVYRYPDPGREPELSGYSAENVVRVKELALDRVGEVIDVATAAGASSIQNVQFRLKDESVTKSRALREAAMDAKAKADALAEALKLQVVGIRSIAEEPLDVVRPMPMYAEMAMARDASTPTPIEPGTIEFRATVTLVMEIRP